MNNALAIAALTYRSLWRSRLIHWLVALVVILIMALAATARGDGTLIGITRLVLEFSLRSAYGILFSSAVWAGCAAVSEDIRRKHIQLLAVKPATPADIWLGRWLGLCLSIIPSLLTCGIFIVFIGWSARTASAPWNEKLCLRNHLLTARQSFVPSERIEHSEVEECLKSLKADGTISPKAMPEDAWLYSLQQVKWEKASVQPGKIRDWQFYIPSSVAVENGNPARAWLRVIFHSPQRDQPPAKMKWSFLEENGAVRGSFVFSLPPDGTHTFEIPPQVIQPAKVLILRFQSADDSHPFPIMFDPDRPVELLVTSSAFAGNVVRSLAILGCELALVAAVSVTAGTAFSMPVAVFVTFCAFAVFSGARFFTAAKVVSYSTVHDPPQVAPYLQVASSILNRLSSAAEPITRLDPLEKLLDGVRVSWSSVVLAAIVMVLIYGGIFFAAGTFLMKKKELALPE